MENLLNKFDYFVSAMQFGNVVCEWYSKIKQWWLQLVLSYVDTKNVSHLA